MTTSKGVPDPYVPPNGDWTVSYPAREGGYFCLVCGAWGRAFIELGSRDWDCVCSVCHENRGDSYRALLHWILSGEPGITLNFEPHDDST